jgi:ribosome biogenesis GTPase A
MSFWVAAKHVINDADIILFVLDARMPEISLNEELKRFLYLKRKEIIFVYNKIDLIGENKLKELRKKYPDGAFVSGIKNIDVALLKKRLQILRKELNLEKARVGVVGYPNTGKSALINALAHRARATVAHYAGTTKGPQWVRVGPSLFIVDTPGVVQFDDRETKLGLLAAKNPEKLKNPGRTALEVINMCLESNKKALEEFYKIKIDNESVEEILEMIGKKRGFLLKGGIVDENRTIKQVIQDWQRGRLRV